MKLTNRQLKSVMDILMKEENEKKLIEMQSLKNKKNSFVNESFLFEDATKLADIPKELLQNINDFCLNHSQGQIHMIRKNVYRSLATLLQKATGQSMIAGTLEVELDEYDVSEYEQQLARDIEIAIDNYAEAIAGAAITMVGGDSSGK